MVACHNGKHDMRFVYRLDDLVDRNVIYDDDVPVRVTEYRAAHFECRACHQPIEPVWEQRRYTPEPIAVHYSKKDGLTYKYDV